MVLDVHFSPDFTHILSATAASVVLLAYWSENGSEGYCVVHISRVLYFSAISAWLDARASPCSNYGEFCGVGSIRMEDLELLPESAFLCNHVIEAVPEGADEAFWSKTIPVRSYRASEFKVAMEHG